MNLSCPHCGKNVSISPEELAVSSGVVICPQCLAQFAAEGVELPQVQQHEPAPAAVAEEVRQEGTAERFCYGCGKELPNHQGLRFCPFCGVPLLSNEQSQPVKEPSAAPVARQHRPSTSSRSSATRTSSSSSKSSTSSKSTDAYRYVPKVYSKELPPEPPSLRFRILAYSIIVVLLAIFGVIIYHGSQL